VVEEKGNTKSEAKISSFMKIAEKLCDKQTSNRSLFHDNLDEDEIDDEPSKGVNKEQYNINHMDGPENLSGSRSASPLLGGVGGTSAPVRHGSLLFQPHSSNNSELVQSSI
jgi:hypothetical protein